MKDRNEKREGYKLTKLGWIPVDWSIQKVKDFGEVITGTTPPTNIESYYGNEFLFVSPMDLSNGKYVRDTDKKLSSKGYNISRRLKKGAVLFTCIGSTIGKLGIAAQELVTNQQINSVVCDASHSNEYLFYELSRLSKKINLIAGIQAVPIINKSQFEKFSILNPPLNEQINIASCLTTWDRAIQALTQLIEQKKLRKKWLMQVLLTGKKRVPGYNNQWKNHILRELTIKIDRKNQELNDNVVTISAHKGFIKQEEFFTKRVASETLTHYYLLKKGEFAFNKSYSNGYPMGAFKRLDNFDKAVVTTLYICFAVKANVNSDFILQFFTAGLLNKGLTRVAQEGGRAHGLLNIGLADFYSLQLTIPDYSEQTAIANTLQTADNEIEILTRKFNLLKEQKKGLMQQLLTGQKRLIVHNSQ